MQDNTPVAVMQERSLTLSEAREQIERMRGHWQRFWFELRDFHEQRGWIPLGYSSCEACVEQ